MNDIYLGIHFAKAVQRHFKLDGHEVKAGMPVETGRDQAFAVTMTVMLGPDDLVAIGKLMRAEEVKTVQVGVRPSKYTPSERGVVHVDVPDADDKVRFVWVRRELLVDKQDLFAISTDTDSGRTRYAIPIDHLTPEQLEGAKIETL